MNTASKIFLLEYDGMGMTSDQKQPDVSLSPEELAEFLREMKARGALPAGVVGFERLSMSRDSDELSEDGDYDVSATLEVLVEAENEKAAGRLARALPPEFFQALVARMTGSSENLCGLCDTDALELVDSYEVPMKAAA